MEACEKIVQVFGKLYVVSAVSKTVCFYTKNLIKSEMMNELNEDFRVIIKMATLKS